MGTRSDVVLPVLVLVLAIAVTGCATKLRTIPHQALTKQSITIVERDFHHCEQAITGKLKGPWFPAELEFASCMIARDYQVWVQTLDASVEVRKASLRSKFSANRILSDMVACEQAIEEKVTLVEKIGRPAALVAGVFFWPVSLGSFAASATLALSRERNYAACMEPRGYVVTPWRSTPGEQIAKPLGEDRISP